MSKVDKDDILSKPIFEMTLDELSDYLNSSGSGALSSSLGRLDSDGPHGRQIPRLPRLDELDNQIHYLGSRKRKER